MTTSRRKSTQTLLSSTNAVIRASAGTGKTYQLCHRFLRLVLQGIPVESILACTFTRKAAGEILDRVLLRLAEAVLDSSSRKALSQAAGLPVSQRQVEQALHNLVGHLHRVRVMTLDAFFAQLGRAACMEVGLPLRWTILDEGQDEELRRQALGEMLARDDGREVERLVLLVHQGTAPRPVATSLHQLVDELYYVYQEATSDAWQMPSLPGRLDQQEIATICNQLAQFSADDKRFAKALQTDVARALAGQWEEFVGAGLAARILQGKSSYCNKVIPKQWIGLYQKLLRHARSVLLDQWAAQTRATRDLLCKFDTYYRRLKADVHGVRFEDVTYCLSRHLPTHELQQIAFRLDAGVDHLLVDEFQDTSPAQWRVLELFARRATADRSSGSFWCVGDVKQAIYGWRGGCAEIFHVVEDRLPGVSQQSLTRSYRSSPVIIDSVNEVFNGLKSISRKQWLNWNFPEPMVDAIEQWTADYEMHSTARTDLPGYVTVEVAGEAEASNGYDSNDGDAPDEVTVQAGPTTMRAAELVAEWYQKAPGRTVGVLTRTNRAVAEMIFLLRRHHVPASEEGGNPLTDSAPVTTILSLLYFADSPGDMTARFHVATSPLGELVGYRDWRDHVASLKLAETVRRQLIDEGYGSCVRRLADRLAQEVSDRDASRLSQLVEFAYQYQAMATLRPRDFVRWVETRRASDQQSVPVRVMTIHQAKGLQFDIVVLPELDFSITRHYPSCVVRRPSPAAPIDRVCMYRRENLQHVLPDEYKRMFEDSQRQRTTEALCLLYVALTRAVHALHIIARPSHRDTPDRSPMGLLRLTLCAQKALEPGTRVYEHGDCHWYQKCPGPEPAIGPPARVPPKIQFARTSRAVRHTSPSRLERGGKATMAQILALDNYADLARGRVLHALFEQIKWWEDFQWNQDELRQLVIQALQGVSASLNPDAILADFRVALQHRRIRQALSLSSYQRAKPWWQPVSNCTNRASNLNWQVYNERRILARQDECLLSGAIDRLVLAKKDNQVIAADILDYKSDGLAVGDHARLRNLLEDYRPQQEAYRHAICQQYGLPKEAVRIGLVFLASGDVIRW